MLLGKASPRLCRIESHMGRDLPKAVGFTGLEESGWGCHGISYSSEGCNPASLAPRGNGLRSQEFVSLL